MLSILKDVHKHEYIIQFAYKIKNLLKNTCTFYKSM